MKLTLFELRMIIEARLPMSSGPRTFTAYRVDLTRREAEKLQQLHQQQRLSVTSIGIPGLFVTDSPTDWSGSAIVVMKVSVQNPLILKNDDKSLEERIGPTNDWLDSVRDQGYDSIVSIPKTPVIGTRQMLLLDPNRQVLSMNVVDR